MKQSAAAYFWNKSRREVVCNHHVDSIIVALEPMYWVAFPMWKFELVAEALKSFPCGREGDRARLDMQNHIDVRRCSLYTQAGMGNMQLDHEPAN